MRVKFKGEEKMKYFFGCTFMNREELANIGVKYPIKLEYYKTKTNFSFRPMQAGLLDAKLSRPY